MEPIVLLVDDEPVLTESLTRALFDQPFDVLTANSAEEALAILARRRVDAIVSDEQMPGMCGSELLKRVRSLYPDVLRIVLTGQASVDATIRAINDAAVFRYLRKPCPPATLAETLREGLSQTSAESDANARWEALFEDAARSVALVFQPIVSVRWGRVVAVEALSRVHHPLIQDIGALLHVAAQIGRIPDLDSRILELVAEARRRLDPSLSVFVNVHPRSLCDPTLWSVDGPFLGDMTGMVVEITEHAAVVGSAQLRGALARIRDLGARIAIDDLGAGHSAFATVADCEPDVLKIDMSVIRGVEASPMRAEIIASLVRLGQRIGADVIAEGIETEGERAAVVTLGCDLLQGYLLARPAAVEQLPPALLAGRPGAVPDGGTES